MSLPDELAEQLLGSITDGTYPPGSTLPSEAEIAELFSVSRLTVREAITTLRVQGVVRVERGLGTFVNAADRWTSLDPFIRATTARAPAHHGLLEARRLLLAGAAELAARNRTDEDLAQLRANLTAMRGAPDAEAFRTAALDFHRVFVRATGNPYLPMMFEPFAPFDEQDDVENLERVLAALHDGEPERAREEMNRPVSQTIPEQQA